MASRCVCVMLAVLGGLRTARRVVGSSAAGAGRSYPQHEFVGAPVLVCFYTLVFIARCAKNAAKLRRCGACGSVDRLSSEHEAAGG